MEVPKVADPIAPTPFPDGARRFAETAQPPRKESVEIGIERLDRDESAAQKIRIKARQTIDELLEQTDFKALADDEDLNAWLNIKPAGREIF